MYNWKLETDLGITEGNAFTLHDALESLVHYSRGKDQRDFHINGHHMNEEFGLWISGGKVIHDDGTEFVPMNEWYERLGGGMPAKTADDVLSEVQSAVFNALCPEPSRGSAPENPATLVATGRAGV